MSDHVSSHGARDLAAGFEVIDDLLAPDAFEPLCLALQRLRFEPLGPEWSRVWPLSEPMPMVSGKFAWSQRPAGHGMDPLLQRIGAAVLGSTFFGAQGRDWGDLVFRVYLQARGMRLSEHGDSGHRGTAVYFAHPRWEPDWGGELVLPRTGSEVDLPSSPEKIQSGLRLHARGEFLLPKPNRLVLIRRGTWHGTRRIDPDAGAAIRCAVAMFATPP
jgi:hypothetical protein